MSYVCRKEQCSYTTVTAVGSVSLALRLMMSSTTNCATESDYAVLCSWEPTVILSCACPALQGLQMQASAAGASSATMTIDYDNNSLS